MEEKISLENITKLLLAADKIRNLRKEGLREGDDVSVKPDKLSMLRETLQIVSEYVPETRKRSFGHALKSSNHYCGNYCDLKRHFREMKGQKLEFNHVLKTMKAIMPMLENNHRASLGKAVSVLEALSK